MKRLTIFVILALSVFSLSAQEITDNAKKVKKQIVSSEYDRNSMTILELEFPNSYSGKLTSVMNSLKVPDKFYTNNIGVKKISTEPVGNMYDLNQQKQIFKSIVPQLLNEQQVGQKLISTWFNRQDDGTFNVDVLKERGIYNSDDSDLSIAEASKRGASSLMDAGLGLVDKSYVLVMGFSNLMTMNQYYDQFEVAPESRKMNGFRADLVGLLYKLDFSDSVAAVFFQNLWVDKSTADPEARINHFDMTTFPLIPVKSVFKPMQSAQYNEGQLLAPKVQKTQDELLKDLADGSLVSLISDMEKGVSDFRVKALVFDVDPIAVKIGMKEGLQFDQRYFVYENRMKRNGDTYSKRKGVVKSMKVVDNRVVTSGETVPSLFYQIAGGKIDNLGMFVEQKNDLGLNLILGNTENGLSGVNGRLEYYISRQLYGMSGKNSLAKGLTSLKIYVEGAVGSEEISTTDYTFLRASFGLSKDFYITHNIHWGPFLGYGFEGATWDGSDDKIQSDFIELGATIGFNIRYNIQFIGSVNYYAMLTTEKQDSDGNVLEEKPYDTYFPDRGGLGISYGIRIMF